MKQFAIAFRIIMLLMMMFNGGNLLAYDFKVDGIFYNIIANDQIEVTYNIYRHPYGSYSETVQIPESVSYNNNIYHVISIGEEAFTYSTLSEEMIIPNSIKTIGKNAFFKTKGLKNLKLSNTLTSIGESAFYGSVLRSIVIPNSVISIGARAFEDCRGLESVTLPNNIEAIPDYLFWGSNPYLSSIIIPSSVKTIGDHAFDDCAFTSITIPEGVLSIGNGAFQRCGKLATVSIPSTVKSIGDYAFAASSREGSIELVISNIQYPFAIPEHVFSNVKGTAVLQIPKGTKSSYQNYTSWTKPFHSIEEFGGLTSYNLSISSNGQGAAIFSGISVRNDTKSFTIDEGTSVSITFSPDNGYQIKSLKVNGVPVSISNSYTITVNSDTSIEVEFEATPVTTFSLSIKATGSGSASYSGTTIRGTTKSFTVNEGTKATITFTPDDGYRIKSLKVNGSAKTASTSYEITVNTDTSVEVEFEVIPPTTYTLSIKATGSGTASYSGTTIRGTTKSFTVNEGTKATITFTPDDGYRIKSLKVNGSAKTASTSYEITVNTDTSVEVEFEVIPPTTYTLSIKATGSGTASYSGTTIKGTTKSFTVNEGTKATITFTPDDGYRIKSLKVNGSAKTASTSYEVTVNADTSVEVEFEAIPATTYTLSIKATGNGTASYSGTTIKGTTKSFTVNEGTKATITFTPDDGYRIKSLKVNGSAKTASTSYDVTVNADTSVEVEFEAIPATTYTLSIKTTGSGTASYSGTTIRGTTKSFTVNEGTKATITFTPDDGYRIKSLKVNGSAKTASTNYKITVNADTSVEVEFEAIPITTYTLSIKAKGNGSATYDGESIRGTTKSYTVDEGTKISVSFNPDSGYRIKSLKVNDAAVSAKSSYSTTINGDTSIEVEFEVIPDDPPTITTYTLSIKAKGNGSVSYGNESIRGTTKTYTVDEGTKISVSFDPDSGYRIKSLKVNDSDVTSKVTNNSFTISAIKSNTTLSVVFEAIPITTYILSIKASGNGSASYNTTTARNQTRSFTVDEGTSATIKFSPDDGYRIAKVKVNSTDVTSKVSKNQYTVTVNSDINVEVVFEKVSDSVGSAFSVDGLNFTVVSANEKTANLAKGNYGQVLEVPSEVKYPDTVWKVVGIDKGALDDCKKLSAIIWNPDAAFTEVVDNPNLLLYVKDANYAPASIRNVVVNEVANNIVLSEATENNDFYCPIAFMAKNIVYTHNYRMETGMGISKGWETIALPFDVQKISHETKGEITPFVNWKSGDAKKPFWLKTYGNSGWTDANSIKANTPYIISMPNNPKYKSDFRLGGKVTFSAENVVIPVSDKLHTVSYNGRYLVPNFACDNHEYALNVNNDYISYSGNEVEGSVFLYNLRIIHPFEAYMKTSSGSTRSISISDDMTTGIEEIPVLENVDNTLKVYDLKGQLLIVETGKSIDDVKHLLPAGVYIVNGKKLIIK